VITDSELKKAIIGLLKSKYPDPPYLYYGVEVAEGYQTPAFFVDLRLRGMKDETINIVSKQYDVYITHFPKRPKETEYLNMVAGVELLLTTTDKRKRKPRMTLKVGERYIGIDEFSYDYVGKKNNLLRLEWTMQFYDFIDDGPRQELMTHLHTNVTADE
jgi:hypothetical protein